MTYVLAALAVPLVCLAAGWLLSVLEPRLTPPERLVNRLWASKSLWQERK